MANYDALDTARWMLAGVRTAALSDTVPGPSGRPKRKTKAQQAEDLIRFRTLCELLWNVEGRPGELADYTEARLAA